MTVIQLASSKTCNNQIFPEKLPKGLPAVDFALCCANRCTLKEVFSFTNGISGKNGEKDLDWNEDQSTSPLPFLQVNINTFTLQYPPTLCNKEIQRFMECMTLKAFSLNV